MKRLLCGLVSAVMVVGLAGCQNGNSAEKPEDVKPKNSPVQTQAVQTTQGKSDVLDDTALIECADSVLSEIGIANAEFTVTMDNDNGVTHDVWLETEQNGVKLTISCFALDGDWYAIGVFDAESKKYYWADEDTKKYQDIYDFKTGELITPKQAEIPNAADKFNDEADQIVEDWNEADFSFYDESGKEKAFTTTNEHNIILSAYEALKTNRGVEIGDRAETALKLYEIPIELSVYGSGQDFYSYSKDSDFEQLIIEYAAEYKELDIMIAFDEDFKPIDSYDVLQNEQPLSNVWLFGIIIIDEKIADIMISHW